MPTGFYKRTDEYRKKMSIAMKGVEHPKMSEDTKKKISETLKKRGIFPKTMGWNKGLHISEDHKKKISKALKGKTPQNVVAGWNKGKKLPHLSGENSGSWKGDAVGYHGLHKWVQKMMGKPNHCAICETTRARKFEWANISHSYKRDLSDWIRLCTKCHRLYDYGKISIKQRV